MDGNQERKEIARQNESWVKREKKRKSNLQKGHPWLQTDHMSEHRIQKMLDELDIKKKNKDK